MADIQYFIPASHTYTVSGVYYFKLKSIYDSFEH